jgi:hypothetical protein
MPILTGSIGPWGPTLDLKVMQSTQRVAALKKAGRPYSSPAILLGLIDTGSSLSALDTGIITSLGLAPRNFVSLHTPSTGPGYITRMTYDVVFSRLASCPVAG